MDATAHTVPKSFDVQVRSQLIVKLLTWKTLPFMSQGYPTLYFVPGDKTKKPQAYEGGRDEESIVAFLQAHRTTKL